MTNQSNKLQSYFVLPSSLGESLKNIVDYFKNSKERAERKNQMKKDLILFWKTFDELSFDDKKGIVDVATFILEDWSVININLDDKEKEKKIKEMIDILVALPRANFVMIYNMLNEKVKTQENLHSALLPDTEYEDAPEDENEHAFGSGSEEK